MQRANRSAKKGWGEREVLAGEGRRGEDSRTGREEWDERASERGGGKEEEDDEEEEEEEKAEEEKRKGAEAEEEEKEE